jgi:hypothetical protein
MTSGANPRQHALISLSRPPGRLPVLSRCHLPEARSAESRRITALPVERRAVRQHLADIGPRPSAGPLAFIRRRRPRVSPIYGRLTQRMFVPLGRIVLTAEAPVSGLDTAAQAKLARGQAYVKRLEAPTRSRGAPAIPADVLSGTDDFTVARVRSSSLAGAPRYVVGLDPTAGRWEDQMTAGPKAMPSVCLEVLPTGEVRAPANLLELHRDNESFWRRVRRVRAARIAVDGPCATSGLAVRADWSGWDVSQCGGTRAGERALAADGVGLFWTTHATVIGFDGASRWIARSLRLFEEHRIARDLGRMLETHPHGAFGYLRQTLGHPRAMRPKTTAVGRSQRLNTLKAFIRGLNDKDLPDHDAVDAACAALVGALDLLGLTEAWGTCAEGGEIWMPKPEPAHFVIESGVNP